MAHERPCPELRRDVENRSPEGGPIAVKLIHENEPRDARLLGRGPDSLGMCLNALHRVEYADGAIEHRETAVDLEAEVLMAGRVDKINGLRLGAGRQRLAQGPVESDGSRLNGDAFFPF